MFLKLYTIVTKILTGCQLYETFGHLKELREIYSTSPKILHRIVVSINFTQVDTPDRMKFLGLTFITGLLV